MDFSVDTEVEDVIHVITVFDYMRKVEKEHEVNGEFIGGTLTGCLVFTGFCMFSGYTVICTINCNWLVSSMEAERQGLPPSSFFFWAVESI